MTTQFALFPDKQAIQPVDHAPYQKYSQESYAAADAILPAAHTLRRQVYDYILSCGDRGATDDETQVALAMNPSTQRPRRVELYEQDLICKLGITRKTRSGRNAAVWISL
jgi:hypothetical protein